VLKALSDGSYIAEVKDSKDKSQPAVKVRVIDYEINSKEDSSSKNTKQEKYILLTNLFDYETHPAKELATLYHERWDIEITFKELGVCLFIILL
jgi:IS4 transposase